MMNTEQELELVWLFEERSEDPCEHQSHNEAAWNHGGPGVWLVDTHATCHPDRRRHQLICDTYKRRFIDSGKQFQCIACGTVISSPAEWYTIVGRKGVDF